jgi:hypothetical protein
MSVNADTLRRLAALRLDPDVMGEVLSIIASTIPDRAPAPARLDISGSQWARVRHRVLERDGFACVYCGDQDSFECDHVIPRSRGGLSTEDNLVAACKACNSSKKDRLLSEWARP